MIDQQSVERAAERFQLPEGSFERLELRRNRKQRNRRIRAGVLGIAIAVVVGWWGIHTITSTAPKPADPSERFGIFAPVAGRILFENDGRVQAVDPEGPADTEEEPGVAPEIASMLVPLDLDGEPIGWSRDGTELLFKRSDGDPMLPQTSLYILHPDGTETRLTDPMSMPEFPAAISPDGSRVVYAAGGLWIVNADGGQPLQISEEGESPTFSPDGTQIAYLHDGQVWVVDADGSDGQAIHAYPENGRFGPGVTGLQWSPAGNRIALGLGAAKTSEALAIYTFARDGSDFTRVISGGGSPFWSPDGTQIAYTIPCENRPTESCPEGSIVRSQYDAHPNLFGGGSAGLAIADADGSNVREFGYAASGPWHPGAATQPDQTTPDDSFARTNGEVLSFDGVTSLGGETYEKLGDLGAMNPETGEERVLVADLDRVRYAEWSADGRWVAYERHGSNGIGLWVVGASREPRLIATGGDLFPDGSVGWAWSGTGAELLWARRIGGSSAIDRSKLTLVDVQTGESVDLGTVEGDVGLDPAWSPDGTRMALATPNGSIYSVDLGSGERSLLASFPENDHDPASSIESIRWSPDGAYISVVQNTGELSERLYVLGADGSNVRPVADSDDLLQVAWSPDGTRLAFAEGSASSGGIRILVASIDGSDPVEIGSVPFVGCTYNYMCGVAWSPDGSAIGFHKDEAEDSAIAVDGSGEVELIDDLTYMSWAGGRYGES